MILFPPPLKNGGTIGVTAPSSGVPEERHSIVTDAINQLKKRGYQVKVGETVWTNKKATSAKASFRAKELHQMLQNEDIQAIIPPWGGEILMDLLPLIDWKAIKPTWLLGYSDTSTLLFALTIMSGIATAHGTNFVDLRCDEWDDTTKRFLDVLKAGEGAVIEQSSSQKYQSEWNLDKVSNPYVFDLDTPTYWKTLIGDYVKLEGRLLGGCIDTIQNLIGTPYADVKHFKEKYIPGEKVLWYFENCEMSATDFYRALLQMFYAGWFEDSSGIMFGRTPSGEEVEGFTTIDAMERLSHMTGLPIVFDADIGHVPPQVTLVNGAQAELVVKKGKATLKMYFS